MSGGGDWYHAHVEKVSRGDGKSAVGLVAYVTGEKLYDEENKETRKRGHPGEVLAWGTVAPGHAPAYLTDPAQLRRAWNDAQAAETRINSHLANHEKLALSAKFGEDDHKAVMQEISRRMVDRYGVMVTWAVHRPTDHGDNRNWHGHLAYNMRRITPEGFRDKAREIVAKKNRSDERRWQRQMFADVINDRLELLGHQERVSPLSYAERGIDKEPTRHRGNKQNMAELKGIRTKTGDHNREVKKRNEEYQRQQDDYDRQIAAHERTIAQLKSDIAASLAAERRRMKVSATTMDGFDEHGTRDRADYDNQTLEVRVRAALMQSQAREAEAFFRQEEMNKAEGERIKKERAEGWRANSEDGIEDARTRYLEAAADHYDIRRPYHSLAQTAMAEGAQAKRDHDQLTREASLAATADERTEILLRRDIQHADYMALTSERLAGMSRVITGNPHSAQAENDMEQHQHWQKQGTLLRAELKDHRARMAGIDLTHEEWNEQAQDKIKELDAFLATRPEKDKGFGPTVDLPETAPNRDRPQNDQRPRPDNRSVENDQDVWAGFRATPDQPGERVRQDEQWAAQQQSIEPAILAAMVLRSNHGNDTSEFREAAEAVTEKLVKLEDIGTERDPHHQEASREAGRPAGRGSMSR